MDKDPIESDQSTSRISGTLHEGEVHDGQELGHSFEGKEDDHQSLINEEQSSNQCTEEGLPTQSKKERERCGPISDAFFIDVFQSTASLNDRNDRYLFNRRKSTSLSDIPEMTSLTGRSRRDENSPYKKVTTSTSNDPISTGMLNRPSSMISSGVILGVDEGKPSSPGVTFSETPSIFKEYSRNGGTGE